MLNFSLFLFLFLVILLKDIITNDQIDAYLAGILDAHGSFRVKNSISGYYARIWVYSSNKEWLAELQEITGYGEIYEKNRTYAWSVQNQEECKDLLESVIPYLTNSQRRAERFVDFLSSDDWDLAKELMR